MFIFHPYRSIEAGTVSYLDIKSPDRSSVYPPEHLNLLVGHDLLRRNR